MRMIITKAALCVVTVLPIAAVAREIRPYDPKPKSYEVDGKTMSAAEATIAYLQGKTVKLCKGMAGVQASKTYRIAGKEVKGSELTTCEVQELVGKANGTGFAKKK